MKGKQEVKGHSSRDLKIKTQQKNKRNRSKCFKSLTTFHCHQRDSVFEFHEKVMLPLKSVVGLGFVERGMLWKERALDSEVLSSQLIRAPTGGKTVLVSLPH